MGGNTERQPGEETGTDRHLEGFIEWATEPGMSGEASITVNTSGLVTTGTLVRGI